MTDPTIDDQLDTIEAGELLGFIDTWLAQAPPAVIADLERYAWPSTLHEVRRDLATLATKLTDPPTPTRARP